MLAQSISSDLIECIGLFAVACAFFLASLMCFMLEGRLCRSKASILAQFLALFAAALLGLGWLACSLLGLAVCAMGLHMGITFLYGGLMLVTITGAFALDRKTTLNVPEQAE